tara:strand:+ start:1988 stop:2917 length:930 start_codon:yes stop_codon:yes gene_type:complete
MIFKNKSLLEISNTYKLLNQKFKENKNLQIFLKKKKFNDEQRIKMSYNVQSGTYIKFFNALSKNKIEKIYYPIVEVLKKDFASSKTILDFGCGELTTSLYIFNKIKKKIKNYFANDVSLNRLILGQNYLNKKLKKKDFNKFNIFCNSNTDLPFKDNSIDLVITIHALEPNNKNKKLFINELLRVCKKGLILMEPHYEIANDKQKKRMKKFDYIRNIKQIFNNRNCDLKIIKKKYHINNMNASSLFVIKKKSTRKNNNIKYVEPKTHGNLKDMNKFLYSSKSLRLYPVYNNIPIFSDESQFFLPSVKNSK